MEEERIKITSKCIEPLIMRARGLIDPSLMVDLLSEELIGFWDKFGPIFKEFRVRADNPRLCENQEYLYSLLKQRYTDLKGTELKRIGLK
jgi:hypothetical protein